MNRDQFQTVYRAQPSPLYTKLKELRVTAGAAARYLGISYTHALNQLNGNANMQPETERKLKELINMFQK